MNTLNMQRINSHTERQAITPTITQYRTGTRRYVCRSCGTLVELVYLPGMQSETRQYFRKLAEHKFCSKCHKA
jgi:hypothetical protein